MGAKASPSGNGTKVQNTAEMSDEEFWQRIVLEALVNDDPAKALAMRVEEFFDTAAAYPRQRDTLRVKNVAVKCLWEWLETSEFNYDDFEADNRGFLIRGIEYTRYNNEGEDD